jgi:hypothetical protein
VTSTSVSTIQSGPRQEHDAIGRLGNGDPAHLELIAVDEPLVEAAPYPRLQMDLLRPVGSV